MKLGSNQPILLIALLSLLLVSCGAGELNKKAVETGDNFYKALQKKDFTTAVNLCADKAFSGDSKQAWTEALRKNSVLLGDIKSFTKTSGFNIATSTSVGTTVTFTYDVQWQYGKSLDSLIFLKQKDGSMKIYRYSWDRTNSTYLKKIAESEKQAGQYMSAVKDGNYDAAIALCSDEALKITPKENWKSFLDKASSRLGNISGYQVLSDSSYYNIDTKGDSGPGNYYDIFVRTTRNGNEVMEKIVFFQKNYDDPVKLVGHFFL